MKEKAANKSILALPVVAILVALAAFLAGCSSAPSLADTFKYQSPFTIGNMEYTISHIAPGVSHRPATGITDGVMCVTIKCKALADDESPSIESRLTMYDSTGHENGDVFLGKRMEIEVGKLKEGAVDSFFIGYHYNYEEPWYELQLDPPSGDTASFKFSIDPETLEVTILED